MKLEKLVGERFKEKPADCVIDSHALMLRGGYMKYVANGIFSSYMPLRRITRKIEQIIREEMDAIDGQEVQFPVVLPASLWEESGRYGHVGRELLRFSDRNKSPMVLGMTHEEAAVQLVREYGQSYSRYPFMIYQIQTKFRDEPRCRGGLIRVREFTMKDAYSFHTSQADLEDYYQKCYDAYNRIFARAGVPQVVAVAADSGMMGGKISHEYMLLTDIGEDSIVLCNECDYKANMEAAPCIIHNEPGEMEDLQKVSTPNVKTIEDLCAFLKIPAQRTCKAVVYQENLTDKIVVVFLRGDLDVNETKLRNYLKAEIHPAVLDENSPLAAGFIGPVGISKEVKVVFDRSIQGIESMVTGANEADAHYVGFNVARDVGEVSYVDVAKAVSGGVCPVCGKHSIRIERGIEVGNIFQLGDKYTKSMNMTYVDKDGSLKTPIMGCYGIGVGRLAASVCEVCRDDYGPIWPISIAPWHVQICSMRAEQEEVKAASQALYDELTRRGIEVIWDDRPVSAGVMFSDADLLGVPVRVVVSPKGLKNGTIEISSRDKAMLEKRPQAEAADFIENYVREELKKLNCHL